MTKRGLMLKTCMERNLCNGYLEAVGHEMRNLSDEEKENRAEGIVEIINKYQTKEEIIKATKKAGFL